MKRPRIALFTPYFPAPAFTGGRVRIQHLARALAEHAELELFASAPQREVSEAHAAGEASPYVTMFHAAGGWWPPRSLPRRVQNGSAAGLARMFRERHARSPYRLLVVEHAHAAAAAIGCGLPWLLDEHNIESSYLEAKLRARGGLLPWHRLELSALRRWEERCWRDASEVVAVTAEDAARIAAVRGRPARHVANGVDLERVMFAPLARRRTGNVLFVGLMDHPPNVHAARWLAREIMPRVWSERPNARLWLCGANPGRELRALADARVRVTGRVDSTAPYLAQAQVFANALAFGGGSSLKVLEALAAGVPLVSTRVGVRGFALHNGEHYLAAESSVDFARAIVRGLGDDAAAPQRTAAGRAFAEAHSWCELAARFASLALELATSPRSARAVEVHA